MSTKFLKKTKKIKTFPLQLPNRTVTLLEKTLIIKFFVCFCFLPLLHKLDNLVNSAF